MSFGTALLITGLAIAASIAMAHGMYSQLANYKLATERLEVASQRAAQLRMTL